MLERRFGRSLEELDALFAFIDEFLAAEGLDPEHSQTLGLVAEELFTNTVKYNRGARDDIALGLSRRDGTVVLRLQDHDVEPFDPTRPASVDLAAHVAEGKPGGLGLHLVRGIAERLEYEYRDRTSTITVTLRIAS